MPRTLVADSLGLTLHPRGLFFSRLKRLAPRLIPWTDLAGARERSLGLNTESGRQLWLVGLTKITLDLVGPSAAGHWPPLTDEEYQMAMRALGIDPKADDEPGPHADGEGDEEDDEAEEEAFWRESYGPDWRRGTDPLELTTSAPDGLVDLVLRWHRGTPTESVLPDS